MRCSGIPLYCIYNTQTPFRAGTANIRHHSFPLVVGKLVTMQGIDQPALYTVLEITQPVYIYVICLVQ
jgi:hypothetical protein